MLSLLIFPFDVAISLPGIFTRALSIKAPHTLEQGEKDYLIITARSSKRFPSGLLKIHLYVKTNEKTYKRRLKCGGAPGNKAGVEIDATHSGVTSFRIRRFWATSILGLISIPIPVRRSASTLVMPAPIKPPGTVALPQSIVLRPKPGGGFSEEHDLRPYREGDQIKTVHWKLSAKHDSLIVREALAPPAQSRLLHANRWNGADERDLILGRLRWVSNFLLERDLSHYIKFGENHGIEEVSSPGDFIDCLFHALGEASSDSRAHTTAGGRFSWVYKVTAG